MICVLNSLNSLEKRKPKQNKKRKQTRSARKNAANLIFQSKVSSSEKSADTHLFCLLKAFTQVASFRWKTSFRPYRSIDQKRSDKYMYFCSGNWKRSNQCRGGRKDEHRWNWKSTPPSLVLKIVVDFISPIPFWTSIFPLPASLIVSSLYHSFALYGSSRDIIFEIKRYFSSFSKWNLFFFWSSQSRPFFSCTYTNLLQLSIELLLYGDVILSYAHACAPLIFRICGLRSTSIWWRRSSHEFDLTSSLEVFTRSVAHRALHKSVSHLPIYSCYVNYVFRLDPLSIVAEKKIDEIISIIFGWSSFNSFFFRLLMRAFLFRFAHIFQLWFCTILFASIWHIYSLNFFYWGVMWSNRCVAVSWLTFATWQCISVI